MIDIQQRLQTIFEKECLVFWYDNEGALQEQFESIDIDGVEKLVIDNNEFGIKRQILKLQPDDKFLIYSPNPAPNDEENWLLDLNIANYMFAADKHSLILQNLGLDVSFKPFISRFDKFFNSAKRIEALKTQLEASETSDSLALKMMAVAIGSDDTIESVLLRIFENEKHFETLQKLGLEGEFFRALQHKFGYTGESLKDLLHKLLQNHFYYYIDRGKCTLNSDARLFVESWMDSSRYHKSYEKYAKAVSDELNIKSIVTQVEAEKMMHCDTYERCDQSVIAHLLQRLNEENIDAEEMERIIDAREHTFWFGAYENIYKALLNASLLFDFVKSTDLKMQNFEEGFESYKSHWYKADRYYRDYTVYAGRAEHLELLKSLSEKLENLYLNGFLREMNDNWQPFAEHYTAQTKLPHQQRFYRAFVEPILQKKQKVFVVISDALRYECGVELASKIKSIDRYDSECVAMLSSLPSYTQLGMASLLPHKTLSIGEKNDIVSVDDIRSSGTANREKILQSYEPNAKAIGSEAFLKLNRDEGRALAKSSSVVYIYHDEIDKMGEKNEVKTFDAVESAFETLIKIIRQIANFNGSNIFVTSDHGFLYANKPTAESEFCSIDTTGSIKLNRRFVIGKGLKESTCTMKFEGKTLGIEGENEFLIAKSINKIRVQGGGNRFVHGGATLQELVIPLITIKKKRITDVKEVNVEIIPIRNISTNTVNLSLYQSEPASEKSKPVTLKIAFESAGGTVLSDELKHTFDSKEQYDTNREVKFTLTFKKDVEHYNNQTIALVARKILPQSSETPVYKQMDVKLALSIFNDFDEF